MSSPSASPVLRNVDKRRQLYADFKRLYRYSGHGVYKEDADGAPSGEREKVTFYLRRNFGETFADGAFFYENPDRNLFLSHVLRAAAGAAFRSIPDPSALFVPHSNFYLVDENALARLGCSRKNLYDLFDDLPRLYADSRGEHGRPIVLAADGPVVREEEPTRDADRRPSKKIKLSPSGPLETSAPPAPVAPIAPPAPVAPADGRDAMLADLESEIKILRETVDRLKHRVAEVSSTFDAA